MPNSSSFSSLVNIFSTSLQFKSDYGNELFLYYVVPKIEQYFLHNRVDNKPLCDYVSFYEEGEENKKIKNIFLYVLFFFVFVPITFFGACLLLVMFLFNRNKPVSSNFVCVVRTKAAWSKIKSQKKFSYYSFLFDDFSYKIKGVTSIYSIPITSRLMCFLRLPHEFYLDILKVFFDVRKFSNTWGYLHILKWLAVRLPHKIVYGLYLKPLLINTKCRSFLSGNKEDRYAILEKRLCEKLKIPTICVPHGLEYGFKMPRGLLGDIFYCTSEKSKKLLERMYFSCKQKFFFDFDVTKNMFGGNESKKVSNPKLVFFPESRETNVNIEIIKSLVTLDRKIYLKLHPADNIDNYSKILNKDCVLEDLDEALNGNICLARRSTVLLESVYRNGYPCAVLFNRKDKMYVEQVFPSLANRLIKSVNNLDELKLFLKNF